LPPSKTRPPIRYPHPPFTHSKQQPSHETVAASNRKPKMSS
jgi:hypothetical protein